MENVIELNGGKTGPTSMILVGVHGNEICGINALVNLFPSLKIEAGRLLIGYGNPKAIKENKRFVDTNLNRMFKNDNLLSKSDKESYEYVRAQFLEKYLNQADALLDIHASYTPESHPFVICESNANQIVRYLPFDLVVSGFDELEPGGTDYYMNSIGKIGICVECGYLGDSKSTKTAEKTIINFLKIRGHITGDIKTYPQIFIQMNNIYITKTNNFKLTKEFSDFEEILKGQIIGIDGEKEVKTGKDSVILFARNREHVGDEAFLLGEKKDSLT